MEKDQARGLGRAARAQAKRLSEAMQCVLCLCVRGCDQRCKRERGKACTTHTQGRDASASVLMIHGLASDHRRQKANLRSPNIGTKPGRNHGLRAMVYPGPSPGCL